MKERMKKEKLPILRCTLDICVILLELIILMEFKLSDTLFIMLYSLISISLALLIFYIKSKDYFMLFLSFVKKNFLPLLCFFLLNAIWARCLVYTTRSGIEVGITILVLGIPIWLLNSFIFQPLFFNRLINNSKWRSRYILYITLSPFIFEIFGDLGPTQMQIIGSVLLSIVIPLYFLIMKSVPTPHKRLDTKQ